MVWIWNVTIVACFKILPRSLAAVTEEYHEDYDVI
jgi:hypothetical protein